MAIINIPGILPNDIDFHQPPIGVSPLGTVVFDDVTFKRTVFWLPVQSGSLEYEKIETKELKLQSVKIFVAKEKNIINTPIQGNERGSVQEYYSGGDVRISMNGVIAELFNVMPYDQLRRWALIERSPDPVPIVSRFLYESFGIEELLIKKFDISTIPGSTNSVNFFIEAEKFNEFDPNDFIITVKSTPTGSEIIEE